MEEGYPGEVMISATFTLSNENGLEIQYKGMTSKPTLLHLSNHTFFNLCRFFECFLNHTTRQTYMNNSFKQVAMRKPP